MSESARKSYGKRPPAESFDWYWVEGGEEKTGTFTPKRALTFDEQLDYDARKATLTLETAVTVRKLSKDAKAIDVDADGEEADPSVSLAAMVAFLDARQENDQKLWEHAVECVLLLISDDDRDRLRPILMQAYGPDVRALREDLEEKLMARTEAEVAAVAQVDPTSPPSPDDSPQAPDSGPT